MRGRRLRHVALAASAALLGALAIAYGVGAPGWTVPFLVAAGVLLGELVSLSRGPAPGAQVERAAVTALVATRLLGSALLAFAGAAAALLAAAVPARHGLATGLLGATAAATLFLLVSAVARLRADPGRGVL